MLSQIESNPCWVRFETFPSRPRDSSLKSVPNADRISELQTELEHRNSLDIPSESSHQNVSAIDAEIQPKQQVQNIEADVVLQQARMRVRDSKDIVIV